MKPFQVDFKSSKRFVGLFVIASVAACIVLVTMPISWQIKAIVVSLIVACVGHTILLHGLKCLPASVVSIRVDSKNDLHILHKSGEEQRVTVAANTTVTPYLVVLNVDQSSSIWWKRFFGTSIIILPDHAHADNLRQLRVWLKWAL